MSLFNLLIVYLIGVLVALGLQCGLRGLWTRVSLREVGQILLIAFLWPPALCVVAATMVIDLACFLIAVIRKPH